MGVFSHRWLVYLCFRVVGTIDGKVEFDFLIEPFCGSIYLWMKGSGYSLFNS